MALTLDQKLALFANIMSAQKSRIVESIKYLTARVNMLESEKDAVVAFAQPLIDDIIANESDRQKLRDTVKKTTDKHALELDHLNAELAFLSTLQANILALTQ